jgi:DNA-binding transcriptional ArsR family regulator
MDAANLETQVSGIAASIGEPARARILYCLLDGHARTSTELAIVAEVSPSTASVHLSRLKEFALVQVHAQGRHRYYSLKGAEVARALEALSVIAGNDPADFVANSPSRLRAARTCYDHIAGEVAVALHDKMQSLTWIRAAASGTNSYDLTARGIAGLTELGIDIPALHAMRRRFAYPCLDWSERRPHIGGALGAALLKLALHRKWLRPDVAGRGLSLTAEGRRGLALAR